MKTPIQPPDCALRAVIYTAERRLMIFTSKTAHPVSARKPLIRRRSPFRVKLMMTPEAQFSFEPAVQLRSRTKS